MKRIIIGVVVGVVLAAGGVAVANIPDAGGVIHGCVLPSGQLRVIDADKGQTCKSNEKSVSWGTTGLSGYPGNPGSPSSGTPISHTEFSTLDPNNETFAAVTAMCPVGDVVLSGGFFLPSRRGLPASTLIASFLTATNTPAQWGWEIVVGLPPGPGQVGVTVEAVCAKS